jgi:hypothetical protein
MRNYIEFILKLLVTSALCTNLCAEECREISKANQRHANWTVSINESGSSCLRSDLKIEDEFDIHAGSIKPNGSPPLDVNASNVSVDLQQHILLSKSAYAQGIVVYSQNNIVLRNGSVQSKGRVSHGVRHDPSGSSYMQTNSNDSSKTCRVVYPPCEDISYLYAINKLPPKYQDANITIDNMNIFATYRGVMLADNHNTIRNSTIEVDDNTAIYLMGQYPVIENNTIIIHSNKNNNTEYQKKWNIQIKDGAIKLRDAQGGIIRNNRIIYRGGLFGGKAPVAINLLDSKDVVIEGNTIEGFESLVRENGDTSYTQNNNTLK